MLKVQVKILQSNPKQGSSSYFNLLLPSNQKWSQLEGFPVASSFSTLFAVLVCSKLVHWHPEAMFHFTPNFCTPLDEVSPASQNYKKWLKISQKQTVVENCFLLSIYGNLIKTYDIKIPLSFKKSADTTYTEEIIQSVSLHGSL